MATGEPVPKIETLAGELEELPDHRQDAVGQGRARTARPHPIPRRDPDRLCRQGERHESGGQPTGNRPAKNRGGASPNDQGQRPTQRPEPSAANLVAEWIAATAAKAGREVETSVAGAKLPPGPLVEPQHRRVVPGHIGIESDHRISRVAEPLTELGFLARRNRGVVTANGPECLGPDHRVATARHDCLVALPSDNQYDSTRCRPADCRSIDRGTARCGDRR